jgi:A/G-specific adenine glycosylase
MASSGAGSADRALVTALLRWFDANERPLPWRETTAWGVLVSEFMLQQTPVDRVLPAWEAWMAAWPAPEDLAESSVAEALRAWGRLGYPRRARRLHQAAVIITDQHAGRVPDDTASLRALPGVGEYTAAAVLAFAYGRRSIVLDTNVRRVVTRSVLGSAQPAPHVTNAERARADDLWPRTHARSARWSAAVMEFGALVCTARAPACDACPVAGQCAWLTAGRPPQDRPARRQAQYGGSDRQARGSLLAALRDSRAPLEAVGLAAAWPDSAQRERALGGLVADGLVQRTSTGGFALPD